MANDEVLDLQVSVEGIAAAKAALGKFSPSFRHRLLPRLEAAGERIAADTRQAVLDYPVRPGKLFGHVREALADSIEVKSVVRGDAVAVRIISTGRKLPVSKQALVKAWNRAEYRHPVFGRSSGRGWVDQPGARYFSSGYVLRRAGMIQQAFEATVAEAAAETEAGQ